MKDSTLPVLSRTAPTRGVHWLVTQRIRGPRVGSICEATRGSPEYVMVYDDEEAFGASLCTLAPDVYMDQDGRIQSELSKAGQR